MGVVERFRFQPWEENFAAQELSGKLVAHTGFEPCYRRERAASWTPSRGRTSRAKEHLEFRFCRVIRDEGTLPRCTSSSTRSTQTADTFQVRV